MKPKIGRLKIQCFWEEYSKATKSCETDYDSDEIDMALSNYIVQM